MPSTEILKLKDLPEKYQEPVKAMMDKARERGMSAAKVEADRGIGRTAKLALGGAAAAELSMRSVGQLGGVPIPATVLPIGGYLLADGFFGGKPPQAGPAAIAFGALETIADASTVLTSAALYTIGRDRIVAMWNKSTPTPTP